MDECGLGLDRKPICQVQKRFLESFRQFMQKRTYAAKKIGMDSKSMDKSCQIYGNGHKAKQLMICGTPGLYRNPCQGKDVKTRSIFKASQVILLVVE